jgi:hypothetical protein
MEKHRGMGFEAAYRKNTEGNGFEAAYRSYAGRV